MQRQFEVYAAVVDGVPEELFGLPDAVPDGVRVQVQDFSDGPRVARMFQIQPERVT